MKRMLVILLIFVLALWLAACGSPQEPSSQQAGGLSPDGTESAEEQSERGILIAYDSEETGVVARAAALLEETLGGTRMELSHIDSLDTGSYEFVLLGFYAQNSVLPENVQTFLEAYDFGARTIYPFVFGEDNDAGAVFPQSHSSSPAHCWETARCCFPGYR